MRTIRKAAITDVNALSARDDDFAKNGRQEFVLRAIQRADAGVVRQNRLRAERYHL